MAGSAETPNIAAPPAITRLAAPSISVRWFHDLQPTETWLWDSISAENPIVPMRGPRGWRLGLPLASSHGRAPSWGFPAGRPCEGQPSKLFSSTNRATAPEPQSAPVVPPPASLTPARPHRPTPRQPNNDGRSQQGKAKEPDQCSRPDCAPLGRTRTVVHFRDKSWTPWPICTPTANPLDNIFPSASILI